MSTTSNGISGQRRSSTPAVLALEEEPPMTIGEQALCVTAKACRMWRNCNSIAVPLLCETGLPEPIPRIVKGTVGVAVIVCCGTMRVVWAVDQIAGAPLARFFVKVKDVDERMRTAPRPSAVAKAETRHSHSG